WMQMPEAIKAKWVVKWVQERVEPNEPIDAEYAHIPDDSAKIIKKYQAAFPVSSGANCFSAAAGSLTGSADMIENWLNVEQFDHVLSRVGVTKFGVMSQVEDIGQIRPHDVLVWENGNGDAVHAAYAITDRLLFNKMGQFWFQPWQCVSVHEIWDYAGCLSNGGTIRIMRKGFGVRE